MPAGRLLVPARRDDDVETPVAVDVADAEAVAVDGLARAGDHVRRPDAVGIRRIRRRPRVSAGGALAEDDLRLAVLVEILHQHDFRRDRRQHAELVPPARFTFGIHVQIHVAVAERRQNVGPAVAGEVGRQVHHVGRERILGVVDDAFPIPSPFGETRPRVVERARDDVEIAVVVDVGRRRAPAVIDGRQALNRESRRHLFLRLDHAHQILPREILVAHLAGAAHVERNRAERRRVLLVDGDGRRRRVRREHFDEAAGAARRRPFLADGDVRLVPVAGLQRRTSASRAADLRPARRGPAPEPRLRPAAPEPLPRCPPQRRAVAAHLPPHRAVRSSATAAGAAAGAPPPAGAAPPREPRRSASAWRRARRRSGAAAALRRGQRLA